MAEQERNQGYTTRLEIHGIGRMQFLVESILQMIAMWFALFLMLGGSMTGLNAMADPSQVEDMLYMGGTTAMGGFILLFVAWIWSFFIWYRRLSNMGYGALAFFIVLLASYLSAGFLAIFLWLWMLFSGPSPKVVYVPTN